MNTDEDLIKRKFLSIRKHVNRVRTLVNLPIKEIEDDFDNQLISERLFGTIAQSLTDICTHIVSRESDNIPQTYADCMKELANLKIIPIELAGRLFQMVKMRNLVIHQYESIDYEVVISALKELLDDLEKYKEAIYLWMENQSK
ncbi:MAG: type VII toxin-antitoxin system HepT family RNase toxin [Candidatus Kariarchaeaceae archaeon]